MRNNNARTESILQRGGCSLGSLHQSMHHRSQARLRPRIHLTQQCTATWGSDAAAGSDGVHALGSQDGVGPRGLQPHEGC